MRRVGWVVAAVALLALAANPVSATTLQWWTDATVSQARLLRELVDKFEAEHPGVEVEITVINGWDELWRKILTAVAAGTPPNIVRVKDFMAKDLAARGALLNIRPYYERDRDALDVDPYYESLLRPYQIDGGLYALPWHVYYYTMFYNVDLFENAGLEGPPDTWDDVVVYAQKLTDKQRNIYGTQMMTYSGNDAFMAKTAEMWARSFSDEPLSDPWDVNAEIPKFNLTSPSMKAGIQVWLDMMYEYEVALPPQLSQMPQRIQNGMIGFWFNSPIGASELRDATDLNFRLALLPRAKHRATVVEQNAIVAFANTGNDDLTWELLKFAGGTEVNLAWSLDGVYLPLRQKYWDQPPFNEDPDYLVAREQLAHPDAVFHNAYTHDWLRVMTTLSEELERIYYRNKTVDQGLNDAQRRIDELMRGMYGSAY